MSTEIPHFDLDKDGTYSDLFRENGCKTFAEACEWIRDLRYGRTSDREDLRLIFSERRGTCSSKHAVLAYAALEQHHPEVEIIAGIFLMNGETHPQLGDFFRDKPYSSLPECHCYLRIGGERFDFTTPGNAMESIAPKIVREQRMDPHQAAGWKVAIHRNYIEGWLKRNPQLGMTLENAWDDREKCIALLAG